MGRREFRQKRLMNIILDSGGIPATGFLAAELGVSERTIRNDLNDLASLIPGAAVEDIERMLMLRLRERLPEMTDVSLLKLAEFFLSKKSEVKADVSGGLEWKITVVDELEDDRDEVETPPGAEESLA